MTWFIAIGSDGRAILTKCGFAGITCAYGPYYDAMEAIEQVQAYNERWVDTITSKRKREREIVVH
jgi:hypothetical protein